MIKASLLAAALIGLAAPAASAHGVHTTKIVTKKVTPVVAVSARNIRLSQRINRRAVIAVTPKVKIVTPIISVAVKPAIVAKKTVIVPVKNRRVVRRTYR